MAQALCLVLVLTPRVSYLQQRLELNCIKLSVAPGYIIVWLPPASCGHTHMHQVNHVHRSRWYSDIFDRMHLFHCYTGASLDWRLGRGSICYIIGSIQQCIPWSLSLEIEPATTEYRPETLQLSSQCTSHTRLKQRSSVFVCRAQVFAGFAGYGNSFHHIIPLFKKENVHLYLCLWGYNNYADAYFQPFWEDVDLKVIVSPVKSMDVTC